MKIKIFICALFCMIITANLTELNGGNDVVIDIKPEEHQEPIGRFKKIWKLLKKSCPSKEKLKRTKDDAIFFAKQNCGKFTAFVKQHKFKILALSYCFTVAAILFYLSYSDDPQLTDESETFPIPLIHTDL